MFKIPNPDFYVVYVGKKTLPPEQELRLSDAFYSKDNCNLELVVKVKNCSDPKFLPISKTCDILQQYCRFIEIVEQNYNRLFPKKSFKKAIEIAMEEGVLTDYLDRKSREVINMLCAKYSYKDDIAVKQKEAFEDGQQKKTIDAARSFYANGASIELIAKSLNMTEEEIQEIVKETVPLNA